LNLLLCDLFHGDLAAAGKAGGEIMGKFNQAFRRQDARITIDALKFFQDSDASSIRSAGAIRLNFAVFQHDGLRIVLLKINLGVVPAGGESFVKNLEG
jgi:hypothetical protein